MGRDIAEVGSLIGDPVRAAMLAGLMDGRALPAGELAMLGNIAPQTASFHLSKLLEASLVSVERQGRHKYYRISNESIASVLEALAAISRARERADLRTQSRQQSEAKKELRFARSCYKHLAGQLAVTIHHAMLEQGLLLALPSRSYELSEAGQRWCESIGLCFAGTPSSRAPAGRVCLDWTERHPHLGGRLGVMLFSHWKSRNWIVAKPDSRVVRLTDIGRRELQDGLGLTVRLGSLSFSESV
ncbi:MAG: ArsR family transcriptional regulator [Acidobacteriota bacterium]|nr:ArsR family transcriptional regulator [Acidobacteriota bacterium]